MFSITALAWKDESYFPREVTAWEQLGQQGSSLCTTIKLEKRPDVRKWGIFPPI